MQLRIHTQPSTAIHKARSGGAACSVETTGNADVLRSAVDATAPFGVCGVIGPAPVGTEAVLDVNMLLYAFGLPMFDGEPK